MFDKDKQQEPPSTGASAPPLPPTNAPSNPSHGRRSSIQNISQIIRQGPQGPAAPRSPARGTVSADADTDSEHDSDDDAHGVQMGRPSDVAEDDEDSEGEMDMDETGVWGGVVRRQSMAADTSDMSIVTQSDADEEKTMDFTIAIGGMLPNSPPAGAVRNRRSIGYSLPQSPNSQNNRIIPGEPVEGEVEMDMEMDETGVFGGIIGEDSTMSSEGSIEQQGREQTMTFSYGDLAASTGATREETAMGMDMTLAVGGIINLPPPSPETSKTPQGPSAPGTPSWARPTLSSTKKSRDSTPKEKRNVFAPSPSPFRTTPRKSGIDTAKEVAQKLNFGSTTPASARKRAREETQERPPEAKKSRTSIVGNVFAPQPSSVSPPVAPRQASVFAPAPAQSAPALVFEPKSPGPRHNLSLSVPASTSQRPHKSPRKSVGNHAVASTSLNTTPQRRLPPKSPAKSPALRRMMGEHVSSAEVAPGPVWENETPPTISLSDFLEMAGVQFMEGLPTLNKRRSSVARGILGQSYSGGEYLPSALVLGPV